jgi:hypothetical protein
MIASVTTGCGSSPQSGKSTSVRCSIRSRSGSASVLSPEQNSEHGRWLPEMDLIANTLTISKHADDFA